MKMKNAKTGLELGTELFDNYDNAKKALTARVRSVLEIMAKCKSIDVRPNGAARWIAHELDKVSSHQWQYSSDHETIYCKHIYYSFELYIHRCTVSVPVRFLGMDDEEVLKEILGARRKDLEGQLATVAEPIKAEIAEIDAQIGSAAGV